MFFSSKNSKIDRFEKGTLYAFLSKTAKVDKFEKGTPYVFFIKIGPKARDPRFAGLPPCTRYAKYL